MVVDSLFYSEKKALRKTALLFTIPCAILPILFTNSVFMSIPSGGLLFSGDFLLFAPVYIIYGYGLFISAQIHKKAWPFILFAFHLASLVAYIFWKQTSWLSYTAILTIMATSVVNQYNRLGAFGCTEECNLQKNVNALRV